jgi:enoyl-CoA hydratase/carnithine racemase
VAARLAVDRPLPEVAVLTLDHPERRNALSVALRDEITSTLDELEASDDLKVVVVTGAGETFCAGFDLKEFERALADEAFAAELWASSDRYHRAVLRFPLPAVAAVNGPAIGGGFDLAAMCDIRIAASTARFAHPEYAFGDVVYGPLHDIVGAGVARDLCFTGRELDAEEAAAAGLVSGVVLPAALRDEALAKARRIAAAPREVLMRTKAKALRRAGFDAATGTLDL